MTWVKLDDQFTENPKVRTISDKAFRLYVAGLCHCGSLLTDGVIKQHKVAGLLPKVTKSTAGELVDAVLWLEHPDGYEVKDYLKYNPSREQVLREREAAAERKRKWQEKNGARNTVPHGVRNGVENAAPSHPDPARRATGRVSDEPSALEVSPAPSGGDTRLPAEQVELNMAAIRSAKEAMRGVA